MKLTPLEREYLRIAAPVVRRWAAQAFLAGALCGFLLARLLYG